MPWPKEHKRETREKIVRAAADAFREHGIDGVSVGEVMERAGLTHGGFYAHFRSKDDLLASAIAYASAQTQELLAGARGKGAENALVCEAMMYLSEQHAEHPERGCPIAAMGPELERSGGSVRATLTQEIGKRLAHLRDIAGARISPKAKKQRAAGALACMIGGIVLARALDEPQRSELLAQCRAFLSDALGDG